MNYRKVQESTAHRMERYHGCAEDKASEILTRLKTGVDYENFRIIVSSSIDITVIDEENSSFSEAYNHADIALYKAKFNGNNSYVIYGENDECSARRNHRALCVFPRSAMKNTFWNFLYTAALE